MAALASVRACFGEGGAGFALISEDNRLRLYDTTSGLLRHHFKDAAHLSTVFTAIAWGTAQKTTKKRKKGREEASSSTVNRSLIAVGTDTGVTLLWDVVAGEIAERLGAKGDGHEQRVTAIAFDHECTSLYTAAKDGNVIEWDLTGFAAAGKWQAAKHAIGSLVISPDGQYAATGTTSIILWDTKTKQRVRKYTGHASSVSCLAFSADGTYLVSGAVGDRFVHLYTVGAEGDSNAARVFTMETTPLSLHVGSADGAHTLVAVSDAGVACVWADLLAEKQRGKKGKEKDGKAAKPRGPDSVVSIRSREESDDMSPDAILRATVLEGGVTLLVARGRIAKPSFQRVEFLGADGKPQPRVLLEPESANVLLADRAAATAAATTDVMVLDRADTALPTPISGLNGLSAAAKKRRRRASAVEAEGDSLSEGEGKDEGALTLHERLDALQAEMETASPVAGAARKIPKAESLQSVLVQALRSGDNALLEYCLSFEDRRLVENTVRRLPPALVVPFLALLTDKFRAKPNRGPALLVWLRAALVMHASYLMSVPDLPRSLGPLYQTIDARLAPFKKLAKLAGRLDLVLAQVEMRRKNEEEARSSAPKNTYVEGEDDALVADAGASEESDEEDEEAEEGEEDDEDALSGDMVESMDEDGSDAEES